MLKTVMIMKSAIAFLAVVLLVVTTVQTGSATALDQSPQAVERWFGRLSSANPKITRLHFFIHDIHSGDTQTTVPVAQAPLTAKSPTRFGLVSAMDSPLTVQPDPNSQVIGRCQGLVAMASQEEVNALMTLNLLFTDGKYNGSTLSIMGGKQRNNVNREYPVVGGTGVFRLARGIAVDRVYTGQQGSSGPTECWIFISHYDDDQPARDIAEVV